MVALAPTQTPVKARVIPLSQVLTYGLFGLPLAFAALPIYVHLPRLYGEFLAIPLAVLGAVLLIARLSDALIDPLLGHLSDRWHQAQPQSGRRNLIGLTLPFFALGVWLLLTPPADAGVTWLASTLALTYLCFSLLTITYQAWGADAAQTTTDRSRITAAREGFGLLGVMFAATLPSLLATELPRGLALMAIGFVPLLLACALITLLGARQLNNIVSSPPTLPPSRISVVSDLRDALGHLAFRRLLIIFVVSGIAAALPATLVMFFVADVLAAEAKSGFFLAIYFAAALCGLPLWVRRAKKVGTLTAWRDGMLLAALTFSAAPFLGNGDTTAFTVICILSGLVLGADLVLPATHLAELATRSPRTTATYFGLWNFATKLNLALAAGIALPLLALAGYTPGNNGSENNVAALALFYGGLPLIGKIAAAVLLHRWRNALAT